MTSPRRVREVVLIAASLAVVVVASLVYVSSDFRRAQSTTHYLPPVILPATETKPNEVAVYDFLTPAAGWAVASIGTGGAWVFGTTDAARHWTKLATIAGQVVDGPTVLQFFDHTHGLLVFGSWQPAQAFTTGDGGRHWSWMSMPDPQVFDVAFSDPRHGWATAGADAEHLYSTADGGRSWSALPGLPLGHGVTPIFRSPAEGWLSGMTEGAVTFVSADGGSSWQRHNLPLPSACTSGSACQAGGPPAGGGYTVFSQVTLLPGNGVVVDVSPFCGNNADCAPFSEYELVSLDLGATWRYVPPPLGGGYSGVAFQDSTHWWLFRGTMLYKTSDAGLTWTAIASVAYDTLEPTVVDSKHAWAQVYLLDDSQPNVRPFSAWELDLTSDGGEHWTTATVPIPE